MNKDLEELEARVESSLQEFESLRSQEPVMRYWVLDRTTAELAHAPDVWVADHMPSWMVKYEDTGWPLLWTLADAATDHPSLRVLLVRLLVQFDGTQDYGGQRLAGRIQHLVPLLSPELLTPGQWREGIDYVQLECHPVARRRESDGFLPKDPLRASANVSFSLATAPRPNDPQHGDSAIAPWSRGSNSTMSSMPRARWTCNQIRSWMISPGGSSLCKIRRRTKDVADDTRHSAMYPIVESPFIFDQRES
jgi:hypothetical protein